MGVPKGLKLLGYGAYSRQDTQGVPLLAPEGEPGLPEFASLKNYASEPFKVKPAEYSDIFYVAHLEVTGQIEKNIRGCRFEYEQDRKKYTQVVDCEAELRVSQG
ncbi:hypothetical protein [Streptomyces sp. SYSU K21746]